MHRYLSEVRYWSPCATQERQARGAMKCHPPFTPCVLT
ncbi:hypothetical protein PAMC26510_10585 [Caballeronia sordidicola]|uniref:Uncharacterized protein n=1 Tax=Caballeronia sordidicola TaxID=196367 RepID=A0A242MZV8_CABSO|nr:hypothetical protein PAMC26510_10585 [Caballeronia sordidicola]